jgi:hypothetical protein
MHGKGHILTSRESREVVERRQSGGHPLVQGSVATEGGSEHGELEALRVVKLEVELAGFASI